MGHGSLFWEPLKPSRTSSNSIDDSGLAGGHNAGMRMETVDSSVELVGSTVHGDPASEVIGVGNLRNAGPSDIGYARRCGEGGSTDPDQS